MEMKLISYQAATVAYKEIDQNKCCKDDYLKSCFNVDVSPEELATGQDVEVMDTVLSFSNMASTSTYVYKNNDGDEALFR